MTRIVAFAVALVLVVAPAEAHRVALVIGQNAYRGLASLDNPAHDARSMAELLAKHAFELIGCDGQALGCFDLDRERLLGAVKQLKERAAGADLALVFFAGHGTATEQGNIVAPVDAEVDCATGAVINGVLVEQFMAATEPARHKLVILDACRNNPLGDNCPNLKGKRLSFTRIEAGAMQGFLLVTSTQFGQVALDGSGDHSPFATALLSAFKANPGIYFEQLFNEVARATYDAAQKEREGFLQIPGKVVGGEAPADCLAGKGCVGDARMAALESENLGLAVDASGVRNLLAAEEQARGKPYTRDERSERVAELHAALARIGTSTDALDQEGRRLIGQGNLAAGQAELEEALEADEKAIAESERLAAEHRKKAARRARDLAVLTRGTDVLKALEHSQRATRLDPSDPEAWDAYARAALDAGSTAEAKTAFAQAARNAEESNNPSIRYWATLGLGDVAVYQGDLTGARKLYEMAAAIADPIAKADRGEGWQRDLSVSHNKIGDVLRAQGNLPDALAAYKASLAIRERLAKSDPGNAGWQRDLSLSHERIGDALRAQGSLSDALAAYKASLAIRERLAKADPGNAGWQRDLALINERLGDIFLQQDNRSEARLAFEGALDAYKVLLARNPGDVQSKVFSVVPHLRLGELDPIKGPDHLRAALAILKPLADANRLDANRLKWIPRIEAQLAARK